MPIPILTFTKDAIKAGVKTIPIWFRNLLNIKAKKTLEPLGVKKINAKIFFQLHLLFFFFLL
jgi:hypothetical protein